MDLNTIHTKKELDKYINASAEESTYLEFKHGKALINDERCKDEIAKDISAFANADGGVLIYGIEEKNHVAKNIAPFDGSVFTKEWLEQIINSRIRRTIPGLLIEPIRIRKNVKQSVYVVRIPKSPYAPHQTKDKHFYRRRNFQVVEMEEYEIREAYSRPNQTVLKLCAPVIETLPPSHHQSKITAYHVKVSISIENIGKAIEDKYKLEVRLPPHQYNSCKTHIGDFFKAPKRVEGEYQVFTFPHKSELFQGEIALMAEIEIIINDRNINCVDELPLIARLYYSSGIENLEIPLLHHCKHEGHQLKASCFQNHR